MRTAAMVIMILVGFSLLSSCSAGPTETGNWRMTVAVRTTKGVRTGTTVFLIGIKKLWSLEGGKTSAGIARAEAAIVTLPSGKHLFVAISPGGSTDGPGIFMGRAARNTLGKDDTKTMRSTKTLLLDPKDYPPLVTFGNENDPQTAIVHKADDIAGEGKIDHITIQATTDPVTNRISRYLPWVETYPAAFSRAPSAYDVSGSAPMNALNFKVDHG